MALNDIERLKEKVERDPNSKLFVSLADEYRKRGMLDDAISVLTSGLTNQPNYMSARVSLGKVYLEKNMIAEAREEFEKVISAIPDNLFAHKKLAEIFRDMGNKEMAIREYKTVLKLNPLDEDAISNLNDLQSTPKMEVAVPVTEELPTEEPVFAEPVIEEEFKIDSLEELTREEVPHAAVEDEFEKFRRSISERIEETDESVLEEAASEETISEEAISIPEEEIEDIGDIKKIEEEASAYVELFAEPKAMTPPSPIETMTEDETYMLHGNTKDSENNPPSPPFNKGGMGGFSEEIISQKPAIEEKGFDAELKEAEQLISNDNYFKAMRIYRGLLSKEPANKIILQKVEELKMLLKMLGRDQEAVIEKLEEFGERLKNKKDEFFSNT
jgi:tetratricopeptide (TPR) repeat protein